MYRPENGPIQKGIGNKWEELLWKYTYISSRIMVEQRGSVGEEVAAD